VARFGCPNCSNKSVVYDAFKWRISDRRVYKEITFCPYCGVDLYEKYDALRTGEDNGKGTEEENGQEGTWAEQKAPEEQELAEAEEEGLPENIE
jgi:hypothetical protein